MKQIYSISQMILSIKHVLAALNHCMPTAAPVCLQEHEILDQPWAWQTNKCNRLFLQTNNWYVSDM